MGCNRPCNLCDKIIISSSVAFTDGTLLIDIPLPNGDSGSYVNGCKYCLVVAQAIPDTTTINAPVAVTINGDTATTYPLTDCQCSQLVASQIRTRTKYATRVVTSANGGSFKVLNCIRSSANVLPALPVPTTTTP